ncbi:MAG: polysaccharide biosynthesis C-terminal domain-containing protein [Agathobacter sp.]|nr:polysaccharide biosynthesis C-terminal domain-containing protein [Agathobacter sp.]
MNDKQRDGGDVMNKTSNELNRKRKFFYNSFAGLSRQLITLICGFVLTRAMLVYYGSEINGLVSSITQFLGFITFLEMGIGPVIQSNLYKPLAVGDRVSVSQIVKASENFFRKIAVIFIVYILVLCFVFTSITSTDADFIFTASLIVILSLSLLSQYFWGMTYQLLLNADQKGYIQYILNSATLIVNTVLCIMLMRLGMPIHVVRLVSASIYIFRPIFLNIYVKKHYQIDKHVSIVENPIKQKWNGFAQHLASVVLDNTDVVVLTSMSTLTNVSIYTVYYSVVYGITQIVMTTVNSLEAMWGNMIAKDELPELNESFGFIEWFIHSVVTVLFTATGALIAPFVIVYTNGVSDANYYQPLFGMLLAFAFGMQCYRTPYARLVKAAGHYKQTQNGAFISLSINIITSVIFVKRFGLIGVALGTIAALTFHTLYFALYLRKNIIKRNIYIFIKYIVTDICIMTCSILFVNLTINTSVQGYIGWVGLAIKTTIEILLVSVIINILVNKKYTLLLARKILRSKR